MSSSDAASNHSGSGASEKSESGASSQSKKSDESVSDQSDAKSNSSNSSEGAAISKKECVVCDQTFGAIDKDSPKDVNSRVQPYHKGALECNACHYTRLGVFGKKETYITQSKKTASCKGHFFPDLLKSERNVRATFLKGRREWIIKRDTKKHQKTRVRLAKVSIGKLIVKKTKKRFMAKKRKFNLVPLKEFLRGKKGANKVTNTEDRKKLAQTLGVEVVKNSQKVLPFPNYFSDSMLFFKSKMFSKAIVL